MARTVDLGLKYTSVILDHMFHQTAFFYRLFCFAITYNVLFFAITFFVLLSLYIFIVATCHWVLVTVNNFSFPLLFLHCFLCCFWYFFLNSFRIFEGEQVEDMILLSSEKFLIAHFLLLSQILQILNLPPYLFQIFLSQFLPCFCRWTNWRGHITFVVKKFSKRTFWYQRPDILVKLLLSQ